MSIRKASVVSADIVQTCRTSKSDWLNLENSTIESATMKSKQVLYPSIRARDGFYFFQTQGFSRTKPDERG